MATDTLESPPVTPPPEAADEQSINAEPQGPVPAEDRPNTDVIDNELKFLRLDEQGTAGETHSEAAGADSQPAESAPGRSWGSRLAAFPLQALIFIVTVLDLPVALLGPRFRPLIGYIAIGTAIIAAATWIGGPRLVAAYTILP